MKRKIVIFGAGLGGSRAIDHYRERGDVEILCVVDNSIEKQGCEISGCRIEAPQSLAGFAYDLVIIASSYHKEIYQQLIFDLGLPREKIELLPMSVQKGGSLENDARRDLARKLLLGISHCFDANNIRYHIDHGTLLGIYRDGDLLPWDNDVDIAIHADDSKSAYEALKDFARHFFPENCKVNKWVCRQKTGIIDFGDAKESLLRIFKIENEADDAISRNFQLDVLVKYEKYNHIYWLVGETTLSTKKEFLVHTKKLPYRGVELVVPADLEQYLFELYGDWRTPVKNWNHTNYNNINV